MNDIDKLRASLAEFSRTEKFNERGERLLTKSDAASLVLLILQEIDQTILPRNIVFGCDNSATIQLDVADRRLLRVSAASGFPVSPRHTNLIGAPVISFDDESLASLKQFMSDFSSGSNVLHVHSAPIGTERDPADAGIPAKELARVWNLTLGEAPPTPVSVKVTSFIQRSMDFSRAAITFEGNNIIDCYGAELDVERLITIAQNQLSQLTVLRDKTLEAVSDNGYLLFSHEGLEKDSLAFAFDRELMGLSIGPAGREISHRANWGKDE